MKTYLSTEELNRLSTPELEALRGFLLDRLACIPEGSPLRFEILDSLQNLDRVICQRRRAMVTAPRCPY
jgi:hypothetical protein